jgi:hypothetical protein
MEDDGLTAIHGSGGKDATMEDTSPAAIQGGGNQGLESECLDGPPSLESIRNLPWGYGEGPSGHVPSFDDLLPYKRTREAPCGGSRERHVNLCRTEEEEPHFPSDPQQDPPLEEAQSYYPGYTPQIIPHGLQP